MLAEVLATVDTETDLLILDRGVFDALMWLELQFRRGQVTQEEKDIFSKFVTLDRWRRLIDLTFVVKVEPEVAMERENATRIIPKQGSLMNTTALAEINEVLDAVSGDFADNFTLREFETTNGKVIPNNARLVGMLLDAFESWADQEILAVRRTKLMELSFNAAESGAPLLGKAAATRALDELVPSLTLRKRSTLETDNEYVQLVSCGFLQDKDGRFFVLKRAEKDDKVRAHGLYTLWKGCHLESAIAPVDGTDLIAIATSAVKRRVSEEFHLAVPLAPKLWGIAWDASENHAALMFDVRIHEAEAIRHMGQKEFKRQGRFQAHKGSSFRSASDILASPELADESGLEPWSRARISSGAP